MSEVGRKLTIALLVIATLGFGAIGLCGAVVTSFSLPGLFAGAHENYAGAFLMISVPCLLIGGGLAWWCGRMLKKLRGAKAE
jgi:hypothetical protein